MDGLNLEQKVGRATYMQVMTRQAGSHFPFAHLAANGAAAWSSCIDAHTVNCFMTSHLPSPLESNDVVCSLLLLWSASLSVERGEPFALATVS